MIFKTYDKYFPKVRINIKAKTIRNPCITKGIRKSSKNKQKLYVRFLKKRTPQNEQKYKNYKHLFETIIFSPTNYLNVLEILTKHGIL